MGNIGFDNKNEDIIKAIQDGVETKSVRLDEDSRPYFTREVFLPPVPPKTRTLGVSTLDGLVAYLENDVDIDARHGSFVHVLAPNQVRVFDRIDTNEDLRFSPLQAVASTPELMLNTFMSLEAFIIQLQSRFEDAGDREAILMNLTSVVTDEEVGYGDDGIAQAFTYRRGIERGEGSIKNPVLLRPFRTFPEIVQPESAFVLRFRKKGDDNVEVGLWEADGGQWELTAKQSIGEYLNEKLSKDRVILV